MTAVDPQITNAMPIIAILAATGVCKAIYAGWAVRDTDPLSRLIVTQRLRYTFVALGQGILTACAVWLLGLGSVGEIIAGAKEYFTLGVYGWGIGVSLVFVAASPIITALALINIYRQPAEMAHKRVPRHPAYCSTLVHRTGECHTVWPEVALTGNGPRRNFY